MVLNIIHVDDTPEDRELFSRLLRDQDQFAYNLTHFHDFSTLDACIQENPAAADVIVLDLGLPESDGIDTIESAMQLTRNIPVIPLTGLNDDDLITESLKRGAQDYLVKGQLDSITLARTIRHAIERHRLIKRLNEALEQVEHLATHDSLTGLPNRKQLTAKLESLCDYAGRHQTPFAVLFIDLDHFKGINDTQGHPVGDVVLREAARRIEAQLRRSDFVARVGGDEFVCILQDISHPVNAAQVADKITQAVSAPIFHDSNSYYLSASVGIAISSKDGDSADSLISAADTAMYFSKEHGGGQFSFFEPHMHQQAIDRFVLEHQLRDAIAKHQFQVLFQPIVNPDGAIVSCEALLRWQHPKRGLLLPDEFIYLAEQSGIIIEIGEYVLRDAMRAYKSWLALTSQSISISVNISPRHFARENFVQRLRELLSEEALPVDTAPWLSLEITERMLFEPTTNILASLVRLSIMQVDLSIDDFGTGYSCLYYLKELPVHALKIDRKFITDLPENENDRKLLRSLLAMAESLNLRAIAEGVETEAQRTCLLEDGCKEMQGFLFSPAVAMDQLVKFLRPLR